MTKPQSSSAAAAAMRSFLKPFWEILHVGARMADYAAYLYHILLSCNLPPFYTGLLEKYVLMTSAMDDLPGTF